MLCKSACIDSFALLTFVTLLAKNYNDAFEFVQVMYKILLAHFPDAVVSLKKTDSIERRQRAVNIHAAVTGL